MPVQVRVRGVPHWVDAQRLLGPGAWRRDGEEWASTLEREPAADVCARLRGVGLDGHLLEVTVQPRLKRAQVRAGRTRDARARRERTPGFERPGTRLDDEGRMSLTSEVLAMRMANEVAGRSVLDACCGAGGNAIAFARAGCTVRTAEPHPGRLKDAQHNAQVYGVADRIAFFPGTAAEALASPHGADLLFVDAPWGAEWDRTRTTLSDLPVLAEVLAKDLSGFSEVWAKVPASFDTRECPAFTPEAWFGERAGDRHRVKFVLLRRRS